MIPLPVDALIPRILETLRHTSNLVLEAPPGAGKTTRVPPALLSLLPGEVLVLEPRRLAARLAARRVAEEFGERVGETVGYQVRFEEAAGPRTRLRFMTEGVLTRRLMSHPSLPGVEAVVLDEFHERHLEGDLALALLKRLQRTRRPELRIIVMSATLEADPAAEFLGRCPILRSEGRLFDLDIAYTPYSAQPLEAQVAGAVEKLLNQPLSGDVLVFLPGAAEIRRAARACQAAAQREDLLILPLHGDLPPEEQDRAVQPAGRRKIILSTNVAESSITIDGVTAVIDSGLARIASHSPWTGLPSLNVARVSKASAAQRAGRAGRTAPGRVIRLYSADDFARRPDHDTPEIARAELSQTALLLAAAGIRRPDDLEWLEPPPAQSMEAAQELLRRLGATDQTGTLTKHGRTMAKYPMHPRLSRLVLEAAGRGCGEEGCKLAALLSAGERLPDETSRRAGPSDLLLLLDSEWTPQARRLYEQLKRMVRPARQSRHDEQALLISILAAFPDRVARLRQGEEYLLASGGSAVLSGNSIVRGREFIVAVDIEERRERGLPLVRLASVIEPDWLLDLFPEFVTERDTVEWNRGAQRAEAVNALMYDGLTIQESRGGTTDLEAASRLLAAKAIEAGIERFSDAGELAAFRARVAFAARHSSIPDLTEQHILAALESMAAGLRSFSELQAAGRSGAFVRALERRLPPDTRRLLDEVAPERVRLAGGRSVKVNYSADRPPWIASRLQDFFGMRETPRVARGNAPLVLHLLAPNQRPVQTTTDLAGFWQRLYPRVRKELSRRYPKHKWPEDPG